MRIMPQDLHLFPHKIQMLQRQTDANKAERNAFGQTISQRIEDHPDFLNVNKQNMRFWAMSQPYEHQYRSLNVEKVTVWGTLGRNDIIGLYWFEDADARPVTVNTERYIELMRRKFIPALRRKQGVDTDTVIY